MRESDPAAEAYSPETVAAVRLAMVSGVGPLIRRQLLDHFGSPVAVLAAAPGQLCQVRGVGPKLAQKIAEAETAIDVETEFRIVREHGLQLLLEKDPDYPRSLAEIHDPPGILFVRGRMSPADRLAIGIVGTRHASPYGLAQAERLASGLARVGITVVSGLARGIDGAAHRGALAAGGRTIAVLASGVLNVYPPEHVPLADAIVASGGALASEQSPLMEPLAGMFPQRNRIISGLSLGVLVVEAAQRSGALITARHAMEQGRDVFAVPGRIDQRQSRGCHQLIRDGAKLVETVDDILDELGPLVEATPRDGGGTVRHPGELKLNPIEQRVLQAIETSPTLIDAITVASGLPIHRVLSTISVLEMRRLIRRVSGNQVMRV